MRKLAGFEQLATIDMPAKPVGKQAMRVFTPMPARLFAVDRFMPSIRPVFESAFKGGPPLRDETVTPAEARVRYGRAAGIAATA